MAATKFSRPSASVANGKADKVANATSGNFAALDANGNLVDSGLSPAEQNLGFVIANNKLCIRHYVEVEE